MKTVVLSDKEYLLFRDYVRESLDEWGDFGDITFSEVHWTKSEMQLLGRKFP